MWVCSCSAKNTTYVGVLSDDMRVMSPCPPRLFPCDQERYSVPRTSINAGEGREQLHSTLLACGWFPTPPQLFQART